jgi:hypothetical protein
MRILTFVAFLVGISVSGSAQSQISAVTSDGRKVVLYDDGTWKYVFETDGKKVVLNPDGTWRYADSVSKKTNNVGIAPVVGAAAITGAAVSSAPTSTGTVTATGAGAIAGNSVTIVEDTTTMAPVNTTPVDSVKKVAVVPPPKPKPPPDLSCSALVNIQRDLSGEKYVALSKEIYLSDDKTGFKFVLRKTKKSPVTWTTTILQSGYCLEEEAKIFIIFQNGGRIQIPGDGKANCNGTYELMFGGESGKEEILETLKTTPIMGIRLDTKKGPVNQELSEEAKLRFQAAVGCMPKYGQ